MLSTELHLKLEANLRYLMMQKAKIIFSDIINRRVESSVRASVLSIQSLAGRLLTAMMMPFFGWYADVYSIEETFTLIGIIGLACGLPVIWMLSRFRLRP